MVRDIGPSATCSMLTCKPSSTMEMLCKTLWDGRRQGEESPKGKGVFTLPDPPEYLSTCWLSPGS